MVKEEIPGKGQGIVAARNIKKGEEIFRDMPVISLNETLNAEDELMVNPEFMTSLRKQINNLRPSETKSKYFKLTPIARANTFKVSRKDFDLLKLFLENYKTIPLDNGEFSARLFFNLALVNHSCVPNAEPSRIGLCIELRAMKDISKGEEITIFYGLVGQYGSIARHRKTNMRRILGLCQCPVCLDQVPYNEDTLKKLIKLQRKKQKQNLPTRSKKQNLPTATGRKRHFIAKNLLNCL